MTHCDFIAIQAVLKMTILLVASIDRYSNPGSQVTFYGGRKITVLVWPVCFSKAVVNQKFGQSSARAFLKIYINIYVSTIIIC